MDKNKFYFTFGLGHKFPCSYVLVEGYSWGKAREIMFEKYGAKWCSQYDEEFWNSDKNACKHYKMLEKISIYDKTVNDNELQRLFFLR